MRPITLLAVSSICLAAQAASASIYQWDWQRGDPGSYDLNDAGGRFESVLATFDDATDRLTWSMTFTNQVTKGFTLALNNGPNPKGHAGELVLLYIDVRDHSLPVLTAYGYNGKNSQTSWNDGDGNAAGNQAPDVIKPAIDRDTWVNDLSVSDHAGKRTITFDIDATDLIDRTPKYPDPSGDPWYGIGFAEKLGLWLHPFTRFDVGYDEGGQITGLTTGGGGWFDGSNFTTTMIPTPGALALGALGTLMTLRRRRAG